MEKMADEGKPPSSTAVNHLPAQRPHGPPTPPWRSSASHSKGNRYTPIPTPGDDQEGESVPVLLAPQEEYEEEDERPDIRHLQRWPKTKSFRGNVSLPTVKTIQTTLQVADVLGDAIWKAIKSSGGQCEISRLSMMPSVKRAQHGSEISITSFIEQYPMYYGVEDSYSGGTVWLVQ